MMYDSIEFGRYLNSLREKSNISMAAVCDGICNTSTLSRIENGKKEVSKLVQDRLLGRLGVTSENFENMVFCDEYDRWKLMQEIVKLVQHEEMDRASALLDKMEKDLSIKKRRGIGDDLDAILEMQFYLCMKAQIRCYQNADGKEVGDLYYEALTQTITILKGKNVGKSAFEGRYFSVEEINLIIEYCRYMPVAKGLVCIRAVVEFIDERFTNKLAKAKVYPKAIYYLYLLEKRNGLDSQIKYKRLLKQATEAIECLRDALRSYYLCELLDMKMELIKCCAGSEISEWESVGADFDIMGHIDTDFEDRYGNTDEYSPESQYAWCRINRYVLEELYQRAGVKHYMCESSYIYVDTEVYCIEEIIRTRRKMLGMSLSKLSAGICSERTVSRMEKKASKTQRPIIHRLFVRLGLSGELNRIEIISSDAEVHEMFYQLRVHLNNREYCKAEELLNIIAARVDMGIAQNKQVFARIRASILYYSGKIDGRKYIDLIKEALEYTLPYSVAVADISKYMTNEELACFQNIMGTKLHNETEVRQCCNTLLMMYQSREDAISNYFDMYAFVMRLVASYMGDCGLYDDSDEKDNIIFVNSLFNRKMSPIAGSLYDMLWNDLRRKDKKIAMHRSIAYSDELKKCMILSTLIRRKEKFQFYCEKLKNHTEG